MPMLVNRIRTILIALVVAAVNFAAIADTNAVVATAKKCPQTTLACVGVPVSDTAVSMELKAEVKEAATAAEAQYEKRYDELVKVHDRFMVHLDISLWVITSLIALCGVAAPIIGFVLQWKSVNKTDEERKKLEELNETSLELRRSRIASSMIMMHFTWSEFFDINKNGQAKNGEILLPLYRMIELLVLANKLGDVKLLNDCVKSITARVVQYNDKVGPEDDLRFKEFIRKQQYFADALPCDLSKTLGGKTKSLVRILQFFNKFGITMFGVVS